MNLHYFGAKISKCKDKRKNSGRNIEGMPRHNQRATEARQVKVMHAVCTTYTLRTCTMPVKKLPYVKLHTDLFGSMKRYLATGWPEYNK